MFILLRSQGHAHTTRSVRELGLLTEFYQNIGKLGEVLGIGGLYHINYHYLSYDLQIYNRGQLN